MDEKARPLNNTDIVHPPVTASKSAEDFYRLMECYFNYVCANAEDKKFAPLSSKLGGLFTLKGVWLDTVILLICVVVEAVLAEERFKCIAAQNSETVDAIGILIDAVKAAGVDEKIRSRAVTSISNLKSVSAADKLNSLTLVGAIEKEDLTNWKKRRNKAAHGTFVLDSKEIQHALDDVFRLTTLVYKLVFLLIGYSGKYSNRTARGWRDDEFEAQGYWAALEKSADSRKS